ncbi:MAG: GerAB/ArcD/ProY family transporter [Clostridia bacterium]|nr:GerAB/ArcD/ProY family transporter [Clostridia bacterium]
MSMHRRYIGKWELGCMVFHICVARMFTSYPNRFTAVSGSAGWLTALYTGILFLAVLFLALKLVPERAPEALDRKSFWKPYLCVAAVYWVLAAVFALKEGVAVLQQAAYPRSPDWFIILFLILGAIVPALCGARAIYRMHSLLVLPVGLVLAAIALFALGGVDTANLAPFLGTGVGAVFGQGLFALALYLDVPFLAILLPRCRPEVNIKRTVFFSAALAVAINVGLMLVSSMGQPYEMDITGGIPVFLMAKSGVGMGAVYLLGYLISIMLYLGLALHLIAYSARGIRGKLSSRTGAALLCLLLCITLSGCYDSREVEETAYLIALGVDKGKEQPCRYTFQISNPLETGTTTGENKDEPPAEETSREESNKGVNNMVVEAENFYLALSQLRSYLGKEPDLSHLKVIAFSKELAREGLEEHTSSLLDQQEIRPDTNLCLAESAQEFLTRVKPTLEQSTARYYELMFWQRYSPYAPVTELKDFVAYSRNSGRDPVLPVADGEQVSGIGIFRGGALVTEGDAHRAMIYKLLTGEASGISVTAGSSVFSVTGKGRPNIQIQPGENADRITVEVSLRATLLQGTPEDRAALAAKLEEDMTNFLRETAALPADALGLGNEARKKSLTQGDWIRSDWEQHLKKLSIFTKTSIKLEENP